MAVQRAIPIISSVEFVLGYLWEKPASRRELIDASRRVPSPILDPREVEAVLRGLEVQGLVSSRNGRLSLIREKLHPSYQKVAQLTARDLRVLGVV